jgi:selenoprotein W-related protein
MDEESKPMEHQIQAPRVAFQYCTGCQWGMRAGWMAQELLKTFEKEIGEVALQPSKEGGIFRVWATNGDAATLLWDRKTEGRFPEVKELKQKLRDFIAPDKNLGHSDVKPAPTGSAEAN